MELYQAGDSDDRKSDAPLRILTVRRLWAAG